MLEINTVTQRLLTLHEKEALRTGRQVLSRIAEEFDHPDPIRIITFGAGLMKDLRTKGILIGTQR